MEVKSHLHHPALQEYVYNISTVDVDLLDGTNEAVTPYPPTPFQSLIFYCNNPVSMNRPGDVNFEKQALSVLVGPQFSRVNIKVHKMLKAIRVDFRPGGLYRMLGIPMTELFDAGFDALDFFHAEMRTVNEQLMNTSNLEEGKIFVENFLIKQIANPKAVLPLDHTLQLILMNNGTITIEKAASLACLSIKQFERKCQVRIGMNPKLFSRILRFSKAYRLHESRPELNWTDIACESGYFDQMHLVRDFKVFAGVNPSIIEKQLLASNLRMQKDLRL